MNRRLEQHSARTPAARSRRDALMHLAAPVAVLAAPALWLPRTTAATSALRLTPAQTEGPFYPVDLPADTDFDLLHQGRTSYARGQATSLEGTVTDPTGQVVSGAVVEIWQCDVEGHYRHPRDGGHADPAFQSFGRVTVDAQGRYRFRTIRPVPYTGRTPHIHVKVKLDRRELLTTQVYVAGDSGNARDFLWRSLREPQDRDALTVAFTPTGNGTDNGLVARFPIVVAT